jgi:general secretion pathway protein H
MPRAGTARRETLSAGNSRPIRRLVALRGFTLVELLVVLLIAALLVAVVPPLLSAAMPGVQLKSTARELAASLRYARDYAVLHRSDAVVTVDLNERRYRVSGRSRSYAIPDGMEVLLDTVKSELGDDHTGSIRFYPDGSSTGGRVTLKRGEQRYKIDVDWLTGRVRVLA